VRGKALTVRCRGCAAVLEVNAGPTPPTRELSSEARSAGPPPLTRPLRARRVTLPLLDPREDPDTEWYLAVQDTDVGPMSLTELRLRVQRGEVSATDVVWRNGLRGWETVGRLPEVAVALGTRPPRRRTLPPALPVFRRPTAESCFARSAPLSSEAPPRRGPGTGPLRASQPQLTVIHGGQAAALAPRMEPRSDPASLTAPAPQPRTLSRWPALSMVAGGIALVLASGVIVARWTRAHDDDAVTAPPYRLPTPPPAQLQIPMQPEPLLPEDVEAEHPGIEIEVPRRPAHPRARSEVEHTRGRATPAAPDAGRPAVNRNFGATMAARILRRNRSSLAACERLANRRGDRLGGTRAWFTVQVDVADVSRVTVEGEGLSPALLSCYRSMSANWIVPRISRPYAVTFQHVHGS